MVEDECGAGDGADLAWAGGDVLQDAPADGEQGEPAFTLEEHGMAKRVAGAGIEVNLLAAGWLLLGTRMPIRALSWSGSARVGRPVAAARYGAGRAWARAGPAC